MQMTTIQLPSDLYHELESVARAEHDDPTTLLVKLLKPALQQYLWQKGWQELRELVQRDGGLQVGNTIEEVVEHMRKTREDIFETEYAHLYR